MTEQPDPMAMSLNRQLVEIFRFALMTLLGLIVGYELLQLHDAGYEVTWRPLPSPPAAASELIATRDSYLYVRLNGGEEYRWDGSHWGPMRALFAEGQNWKAGHECHRGWPEFSPFAIAPDSIIECVEDRNSFAESFSRRIYVLDDAGTIWTWQHLSGPEILVLSPLSLCLGGIGGMLAGVVWAQRGRLPKPEAIQGNTILGN